MSEWDLYWLLKLDDIRSMVNGIMLFVVFVSIVGALFLAFSYDEVPKKVWKIALIIWLVVFLSIPCLMVSRTFIPSTQQMAAIIVAPKILNDEDLQKVPDQLKELLGLSIDKAKEMLKEPRVDK